MTNVERTLVQRAAEAFNQGNYRLSLDLYTELGNLMGKDLFAVNMNLAEKRLFGAGGPQTGRESRLSDLKVACIADEFTFHSFAPECNLFQLTPSNFAFELRSFRPDLLFVESAWRGKNDLWARKISTLSLELRQILEWCRKHKVPTVFWNKEDPVHFETFLTTAKNFDYVFTTDIDRIGDYKAALGHDNVYLLPFACQPSIHNPIELYERKDAFCFAGAYYVKYPERTRDLEGYRDELPKFKPLEIFDRNFGKEDVNYQFPSEFHPFIVGTLPFSEIAKAYKGYNYAVNLNSIKQSQSMFARRVYELLGSNTMTISNFSRGVRLLFGDLVLSSDSGKEIVERLKAMDEVGQRKLRLAGLRKVMLEHTYSHRLRYVAQRALNRDFETPLPSIIAVSLIRTEGDCGRVLEAFERQSYQNKHLILIIDGTGEFSDAALNNRASASVTIVDRRQYSRMGDVLSVVSEKNRDSWIAPFNSVDYYGTHYLVDLAIATIYTSASLVGKKTIYSRRGASSSLCEEGFRYKFVNDLPKRSSMFRQELLDLNEDFVDWLEQAKASSWDIDGFSIDEFNYCLEGRKVEDPNGTLEVVDDLAINEGLPISELLSVSESLPARDTGFEDVSELVAEDFLRLYQTRPKVPVRFTLNGGEVLIRSTMLDAQHEYFYPREDMAIEELPASDELASHLFATPGLNLQYVLVFLDEAKNKISHRINVSNKNCLTPVPPETRFVRLGLRIAGEGECALKGFYWGHRKVEPNTILGTSDTLLLSNHYPSYSDLYRYGFVHTRVKAYKEAGREVDVFRLWCDASPSYQEFQDIDVVTGDQSLLRSLLNQGRYKTILVHFLSPQMWDVIKDFPNIRKIIWIHGAEVQPWHRRAYNYKHGRELEKAVMDSRKKLLFWREILTAKREDLHFVFVSRYFASEVMEDVGVALPDGAYSVIHNPINTGLFKYIPKPVEQRKKILSIRPYASATYANDLSVAAVQELSRLPFFEDLEFHFIGDGVLFEDLLAPLRRFENVKIERKFLTQQEIAALHKSYGVFLVPTRMDSQGVSRDEAMSSGLVPITNLVAAIPEFVDETCGFLAPPEDSTKLADAIAALYTNESLFLSLSKSAANRVRRQSSYSLIIDKELSLLDRTVN